MLLMKKTVCSLMGNILNKKPHEEVGGSEHGP